MTLLHVAEHGTVYDAASAAVPAALMRQASDLGPYAIAHARHAYGLMEADPRLRLAQRVLRWIQERGCSRFSRAQVRAELKGRISGSADLDVPLSVLEEHCYIRPGATEPRPAGTRGRPPGPDFEVNPALLAENPDNPGLALSGGGTGGFRDSREFHLRGPWEMEASHGQ